VSRRPTFPGVLVAATACLTAACGPNLPSDEALMATFDANRPAFERVRDILLQTEGIDRVEEGETERLPLSDARRQEVASLMDKADVALIRVTRMPGGDRWVEFAIHRSGFLFAGAVKGITWSTLPPHRPLLATLDDPTDRRGFVTDTWFNARRPLRDGWYLEVSKN